MKKEIVFYIIALVLAVIAKGTDDWGLGVASAIMFAIGVDTHYSEVEKRLENLEAIVCTGDEP